VNRLYRNYGKCKGNRFFTSAKWIWVGGGPLSRSRSVGAALPRDSPGQRNFSRSRSTTNRPSALYACACPAWCGERPVRNPQVCWENVRVPPALKRTCTSSWRKCSAHKKEASFRPASLA